MSSLDTTSTRRTHPVNVGHLVLGLAFLGLSAVWGAVQLDLVDGGEVRWLFPLPWVLAGAAGLLAVAVSGRRRRPTTAPTTGDETFVDAPVSTDDDTEETR